MRKFVRWGLAPEWILLFAIACGGEDGDQGSQQGAQTAAGTGAPAATAGAAAAPGAAPTGTAGTAGTMPAVDPMAIMDAINMLLPECDTTAPTTASCGGVQCPGQNGIAAALCIVPCCAIQDGVEMCGTRSTDLAMPGSECTVPPPPAEPDPLCPVFDDGAGTVLQGCCMETGVCGVISSITTQCITESMFITLPATPPPCDGSGLGGAPATDAGTTPPAVDAGTAAPVDAGTAAVDAGI